MMMQMVTNEIMPKNMQLGHVSDFSFKGPSSLKKYQKPSNMTEDTFFWENGALHDVANCPKGKNGLYDKINFGNSMLICDSLVYCTQRVLRGEFCSTQVFSK